MKLVISKFLWQYVRNNIWRYKIAFLSEQIIRKGTDDSGFHIELSHNVIIVLQLGGGNVVCTGKTNFFSQCS